MIRLFRLLMPAGVMPLMLIELGLIGGCFYLAQYWESGLDPSIYFLYEGGAGRLALVLGTIVFANYFNDLYSRTEVRSRLFLLQQLCAVFGIALIVQSLIAYVNEDFMLPKWVMLAGSALALPLVYGWRTLYGLLRQRARATQGILFIGANPVVRDIVDEVVSGSESSVAGYLLEASARAPAGAPVLGSVRDVAAVVAAEKPSCIILGLDDRRGQMPISELLTLRFAGIPVEESGVAYERICRRICLRELQPTRLIFRGEFEGKTSGWLAQFGGRVVGILLFVLSLPFMLLVALILRPRSPGTFLARRSSIGLEGRPFTRLRFRTGSRGGLARFCLRHHLDALPELWNVLRGEMALVGPRAESPEFAGALQVRLPAYNFRHNVRPGMTGWSQINTPLDQATDALRSLEYDLYYIKHMSASLNAYILATTLKHKLFPGET